MSTRSSGSEATADGVFDSSARLASGLAHEFTGLLFALRMRIETLEAVAPPGARADVAALAAAVREIQAVVDAIRVLGARAGTGRLIRERAIELPSWLERTVRLARHVVPRGVTVTAPTPPNDGLERVDLARLTAAVLLLAAEAGAGPGEGSVLVAPNVERGRLTVAV